MISIVDYGVGNLHSILGAFHHLGFDARLTGDPAELARAERCVLPGVGAFGDARDKLAMTGLGKVITELAGNGKPVLGVCLGMQLLFDKSFEYGEHAGLGLLEGDVRLMRFKAPAKIPHMGWNALDIKRPCALTRYLNQGDCVYYVHSYYARARVEDVSAASEYNGLEVPGLVARGNVYGCQFHPEKSGEVGLSILKAFAEV